jgi:hypothetical protein
MNDSPAREFVAELIRERLTDLAKNHQAAVPVARLEAAPMKEETQSWEEVG